MGKKGKRMKEIDRICFVSLNVERNMYYILNDGCFIDKFYAENDEDAIEIFRNEYGR